jgi:CPA1 family monovalent cation:H+ antiporter
VQRVRDASLLPSSEVWEQYRSRGESGPNQQYRSLRLLVLEAERTALLDARAEGAYDAQTLERAQLLLDLEQAALEQRDGH